VRPAIRGDNADVVVQSLENGVLGLVRNLLRGDTMSTRLLSLILPLLVTACAVELDVGSDDLALSARDPLALVDTQMFPNNSVEVTVDLFNGAWESQQFGIIVVEVQFVVSGTERSETHPVEKARWVTTSGAAPNAQRLRNPGGSIVLNDPPDIGTEIAVTVALQ